MKDTIYRQAVIEALINKGQSSRRYKLGDVWELNFDEIKEVINALPPAADRNSYYRLGFRAGYQVGQMDAQQEIIRCKNCKHRPTGEKRDNLEFPDDKCPSDEWYCGIEELEAYMKYKI